MLKQLERPGAAPSESTPLKNDDGMMQKAQEARALLKKIEERKELETRLANELNALVKAANNRTKGGYCGCL